jgi:hypothetical protein
VTLEQELEAARDAALAHASAGEPVAAVMAAQPGRSERLYLVALGSGDDPAYIVLDAALAPVDDRRLIRDAVVMLGLAEQAEEASIAVHADRLAEEFAAVHNLLEQAGRAEQAQAAADVCQALAGLSAAAQGPRVATPEYLDSLGAASGRLAVALNAYGDLAELLSDPGAGDPPPEAEAAWRVLAMVAAAGDPANFSHAMTSSTAAVEALADDVLERLRAV